MGESNSIGKINTKCSIQASTIVSPYSSSKLYTTAVKSALLRVLFEKNMDATTVTSPIGSWTAALITQF